MVDATQWVKIPGAADKAASLGGESPLPSIAWFGRLAYPMHVSVTVRVLLGRKSHGCPATIIVAAVGETWVASKPGGLNVRNGDDLETPTAVKSLSGAMWEADPLVGFGEGRRGRGRNRQVHPTTHRRGWQQPAKTAGYKCGTRSSGGGVWSGA